MKKILLLIFTLFINCAPQTKADYLQEYKEFIANVSKNSVHYSTEDWKKADEDFHKYSVELKNKFEDELIWKEQLLLKKYELEYAMLKNSENLKPIIKNIKDIKKQIENYSEKQMDEDIEFIQKQAEEISDSIEKSLEKIFQ